MGREGRLRENRISETTLMGGDLECGEGTVGHHACMVGMVSAAFHVGVHRDKAIPQH